MHIHTLDLIFSRQVVLHFAGPVWPNHGSGAFFFVMMIV
jgi:hypothetical protein